MLLELNVAKVIYFDDREKDEEAMFENLCYSLATLAKDDKR